MRHLKPTIAGITALFLLNCSDGNGANGTGSAAGGVGSATGSGRGKSGNGGNGTLAEAGSSSDGGRCLPALNTTGNPKTILETLQLINGLPHPVQLSCFLESLDRPLALNATANTQSAQPALGKRSPRIFVVLNEAMSMSLVPGSEPTLEFGERGASGLTSVKGELHFPIEDQVAPEDAFSRLTPDESTGLTLARGTRCGACHDDEVAVPDYPFLGAFASARIKPQPFFEVTIDSLRRERDACDSVSEPERCSILQAIFEHGEVVQTAFP